MERTWMLTLVVYFKCTICPEEPRTTTERVRQVSLLPYRCEYYFKTMFRIGLLGRQDNAKKMWHSL